MAAAAAWGCCPLLASVRPCHSLRDWRPAPPGSRLSSSTRTAVLERAAELRAASRPEPAEQQQAALPPAPGGGSGGGHADGLHLSPVEREEATHEILRLFLSTEGSSNGSSSSNGAAPHARSRLRQHRSGGGGGPHEHSHAAEERGTPRQRGLQGRVVEHLLGGGFDEALLEPVPTHTLNWAIQVLGEQGQPGVAEQLFHWMRVKGRANEHSFVKLCRACAASVQPWRALHAWRTTRRMPQAENIVGSRAGAALILAYRSTADHTAALSALSDLQRQGVAVDRYAYNAAIRVCADAGAAEDALRVLRQLREAAAAERQRAQGRPQHHAMAAAGGEAAPAAAGEAAGEAGAAAGGATAAEAAAAQAAAAAGEREAMELAFSQRMCPPEAQQHHHSPQQAQQQQQQSHHLNGSEPLSRVPSQQAAAASSNGAVRPGQAGRSELEPDVRSYSAALSAVAAAGWYNRTALLHRWMQEDGVQPDAPLATELLSCYAAVGQAAAAQRLFDAMQTGPAAVRPNRSHWNALLLALAEARDGASCAAAYRQMTRTSCRPDSYTFVALLRAAFRAGAGLPAVKAVRAEAERLRVPLTLQLGTAMLACLRHVEPPQDAAMAAAAAALAGLRPAKQQQHAHRQQQQQQGEAAGRPGLPPAVVAAALAAAGAQGAAQPGSSLGGSLEGRRAASLAEATSIFELLQAEAGRGGHALDLLAWNALLAVQLAAGDHAAVLATVQSMEAGSEGAPQPDAASWAAAIAACEAAGWKEEEARLRQRAQKAGRSTAPARGGKRRAADRPGAEGGSSSSAAGSPSSSSAGSSGKSKGKGKGPGRPRRS